MKKAQIFMNKTVHQSELGTIVVYELLHDYVKAKYGDKKQSYVTFV